MMQGLPPSSDDRSDSFDDCNGSCDGNNGSVYQDKLDRPPRPTLQEMLQ